MSDPLVASEGLVARLAQSLRHRGLRVETQQDPRHPETGQAWAPGDRPSHTLTIRGPDGLAGIQGVAVFVSGHVPLAHTAGRPEIGVDGGFRLVLRVWPGMPGGGPPDSLGRA